CNAEAFGHSLRHLDGGAEVDILHIEIHATAGEGVVEDNVQTKARGDSRDQAARVPTIVKVMALILRSGGDNVGAVDKLRRFGRLDSDWPESIVQALLSKFILRIELERLTELRQRFDLMPGCQVVAAFFEQRGDQLLPQHLARRQVLNVLRDKARGFF